MFRPLPWWACLAVILLPAIANAQVTIGANAPPAPGAILDVRGTAGGLLPPRLTTTQRLAISNPTAGVIVFDQTLHALMIYDGSGWKKLASDPSFEAMERDTATQNTTNFGLAVDIYDTDAIVAHTSGVYFYKFNGTQWVQTQHEPIPSCGSVSIYDGFAFVGRPGARSVYVYEYNADPREMRWIRIQDLPGDPGTTFGYSVAINEVWGIVGCTNCATTSSKFFAYRKTGGNPNSPTKTGWLEVTTPAVPYVTAADQFGNAVDVDGDQCIIGCWQMELGSKDMYVDAGAAYVFRYNGTAWALEQRLAATDTADYARFGSSVAIYGNYAAVGAYYKDGGLGQRQGAAYVFERKSEGSWHAAGKLLPPDSAAYDQFGNSISLFEDRLVVGAVNKNGIEAQRTGAAYLYQLKYGKWRFQRKLQEPFADQQIDGKFGGSLSIFGPTILIGAPGKRSGKGDVYFVQ